MEPVDSDGGDWSSRSDLCRFCLALVFAVAAISGAAHILSYFGVVVIGDRAFQKWSTLVLFGVLMWIVLRRNRGAVRAIPWQWCVVLWIAWINAFLYIAVLPIGGPQSRLWPAPAKWLNFEGSDLMLLYARASSADQLAIAFSLFLALWCQPVGRTRS
jgi:hypothetical protein